MQQYIISKKSLIILLFFCIYGVGHSETFFLSDGSSIEGTALITEEVPAAIRSQHLSTHLIKTNQGDFKYVYGSTRHEKIDKYKARRKKNKRAIKNKEIAFPDWMLFPAAFLKSSNDQLTVKYGLDVGWRYNLPVLERSLKF